MVTETAKRTTVKTVTWKIVGGGMGWLIAYLITGDAVASTLLSFSKSFVNLFLYIIHERVWARINWGMNFPTTV